MQDDNDLQLVPADRVSLAQRVAIMNAAYADYYIPIRVNSEQMALMDEFYDVAPSQSVVARTRWECVGQALLALRDRRAWISGVGVVPAWRRRGVARAMMRHLLDEARLAGAAQALLEVIDRNVSARGLYTALGMRRERDLLSWQRPAGMEASPIPPERLRSAPADELLGYFPLWHERPPSWQREEATLRHMARRLLGYRLDLHGYPAAYCLAAASEDSVAMVDLGINPDFATALPARTLLQALSARYLGHALSIMNVPAGDPLNEILAELGFVVTLRQLEMNIDLRKR